MALINYYIRLPNITQFLTLCILVLFLLLDFVEAQATSKKDDGNTNTRYYYVIIPIPGAALAVCLRKCCGCGKSKETEPEIVTPIQSNTVAPVRSTRATPTRSSTLVPMQGTTFTTARRTTTAPTCSTTTETPTRIAPIVPKRSKITAEETNISAETFMSQRMRDRQSRNRDRIYSIPMEMDERNTTSAMNTYPGSYLNGGHPNTERFSSIVQGKSDSEAPPPAYHSLYHNKQ